MTTTEKSDCGTSGKNWNETKEKIQTKWSKLTPVEVDSMKNDLGLLKEKLQKTYGYSKEVAQKEYDQFITPISSANAKPV